MNYKERILRLEKSIDKISRNYLKSLERIDDIEKQLEQRIHTGWI